MVGGDRAVAVGLGFDEILVGTSMLVPVLVDVGMAFGNSILSGSTGIQELDGQVKCSRPRYKPVTINKKQNAASSGVTITLRNI